jgi:glyoxylase I family protein
MNPRFAHVALNCDDLDRIIAFYTENLGFRVDRVFDMGGGKRIAYIQNGAFYLELFEAEGARPDAKADHDGPGYSGLRHIAFTVDDVDQAVARLVAAGARLNLGPAAFDQFIPGWRSAWLADPEGNVFEVSQGYQAAR